MTTDTPKIPETSEPNLTTPPPAIQVRDVQLALYFLNNASSANAREAAALTGLIERWRKLVNGTP